MTRRRLALGCMTGTSLDGLDVAGVAAIGSGLEVHVRLERTGTMPLGELAPWLRAYCDGAKATAGEAAEAALRLGELHARALKDMHQKEPALPRPDVIAIHGQTVFHRPPVSWQLVNPWPVAREFGCPIVCDLRGQDLALGGEGAPITPLADWVMFRSERETRAIVNLGGFCNVTILPRGASPEDVRAGDACACNHVLDGVARRVLGRPFDAGGARASQGRAREEAVRELVSIAVSTRNDSTGRRQTRSLGTGDEAIGWIERWAEKMGAEDLAASAAEGIAMSIAGWIREALHGVDRIIVAGGGALNDHLVRRLAAHAGCAVETTECFGVPVTHREAAQMAVLGLLAMDGVEITLPWITGRGGSGAGMRAGMWIGRADGKSP